ncbi:MAG: choice-of-anchor tandem repeat GloVer-containing protein [Terriglobales bacterium]
MITMRLTVCGPLMLAVLCALLTIAVHSAQAQTETVLYNFCSQPNCSDGSGSYSSLTPDGAGNFYGTTNNGGLGYGTVFELSPNGGGGWNEAVLYSFTGGTDGANPNLSYVITDSAGNLYGAANQGGGKGYGAIFELSPEPNAGCPSGSNTGNGWCESVLYSFTSTPDGAFPVSGLTWDQQGNLYGTTFGGGNGSGAVYELSPNGNGGWNESVLYGFCSQPNCIDGGSPNGLVQATPGIFYGTTQAGGTYAFGTVFELGLQSNGCPAGSYSGNGWCEAVVHNFAGHPADGRYPTGTPVLDGAGNIYGTTLHGGYSTCDYELGCGTVWKLVPVAGGGYTEEILHNFESGPATVPCCYPTRLPHYPSAGVVLDSSGNIYGTTTYGGASSFCTNTGKNSYEGCGELFEIIKQPSKRVAYKFETLWVFNWANGANPVSALTFFEGNLYGTSYNGGPGASCPDVNGCGVAFEFTP